MDDDSEREQMSHPARGSLWQMKDRPEVIRVMTLRDEVNHGLISRI